MNNYIINQIFNHKTSLKHIITFFFIAIFLLNSPNVHSKNRQAQAPSLFLSHIGFYGGAGYSNLLHNIQETHNTGGANAVLGIQYLLNHPNHFNMNLGIEAMYFNSLTKINSQTINALYIYNDPNHSNLEMQYITDFHHRTENHNILSINIPLTIGAEFNNFYFALGTKAKYAFKSYSINASQMTATAKDPEFIEDLENISTHNINTHSYKNTNRLNFNFDLTASAEIGLIIGYWKPYRFTYSRTKRNNKHIHYRLGIYADYGILNQNTFTHTDPMLTFPNTSASGNPITIPENGIHKLHINSILNQPISLEQNLHTLTIGIKLAIFIQTTPGVGIWQRSPCKCSDFY